MTEFIYLTVVNGRHDIVRRMLDHCHELRCNLEPDFDLKILVACSPADAAFMTEYNCGWKTPFLIAPNLPISLKHQAALEAARVLCPAAAGVLYSGSDDFLSAGYVRFALARAITKPHKAFGVDRCFFLDAASGQVGLWTRRLMTAAGGKQVPCGAGRCYPRMFLDAVGWKIWPFAKNKGLDIASGNCLELIGHHFDIINLSAIEDGYVLDVKTPDNLHPWGEFIAGNLLAAILDNDAAAGICRAVGVDRNWWKLALNLDRCING